MDDQALDRALDVEHLEPATVEVDGAGIGDLAAGLRVERGAVEDQLADLTRRRARVTATAAAAARRAARDSVSRVS